MASSPKSTHPISISPNWSSLYHLSKEKPLAHLIKPIIGHKVWRVYTVDGYRRLRSLYADSDWEVGVPLEAKVLESAQFSAICEQHYTTALCPDDCIVMSGIYAFKHSSQIFEQRANAVLIWGEVALWGKVREYEYGYKAQFGYPSRLCGYVCSVCRKGTRTIRELSLEGLTATGAKGDAIALCIPCFINKQYKFAHYNFIERDYNELMDLSMRYIGEWNP